MTGNAFKSKVHKVNKKSNEKMFVLSDCLKNKLSIDNPTKEKGSDCKKRL